MSIGDPCKILVSHHGDLNIVWRLLNSSISRQVPNGAEITEISSFDSNGFGYLLRVILQFFLEHHQCKIPYRPHALPHALGVIEHIMARTQ